jgi:hypothetical protein
MDIIKKSRREVKHAKPTFELDNKTALSWVCDSVVFVPTGKSVISWYKKMNVVLYANGKAIARLKNASDILCVEASTRSFKMDCASKNGLLRLFPTFGRLRVDWNGTDLHVTRLANDDETV